MGSIALSTVSRLTDWKARCRHPARGNVRLFDYWKPLLTDVLIDSVQADDGVLLYLASGEMKRLFDWARVERTVQVISPEFRVMQGDKQKTIVVYAKMMRGALTRHVLTYRIARPEDLRDSNRRFCALGRR